MKKLFLIVGLFCLAGCVKEQVAPAKTTAGKANTRFATSQDSTDMSGGQNPPVLPPNP